jgi:hypothetical protein
LKEGRSFDNDANESTNNQVLVTRVLHRILLVAPAAGMLLTHAVEPQSVSVGCLCSFVVVFLGHAGNGGRFG